MRIVSGAAGIDEFISECLILDFASRHHKNWLPQPNQGVNFTHIVGTKRVLVVTCHAQPAPREKEKFAKLQKLALQRTTRAKSVRQEDRIRRRICLFFHAVRAGDQPGPGANSTGIADPKPPIAGTEVIASIGNLELIEA